MDKTNVLEQYKNELAELQNVAELSQDMLDRKNWLINQVSEIEHSLKTQEQLEQEKAQREQEHLDRIKVVADKTVDELDKVKVSGLTIRQLCAGDQQYAFLKMAIQEMIGAEVEALSKQIFDLQEENSTITREAKEEQQRLTLELTTAKENLTLTNLTIKDLYDQLNTANEMRKDAEAKRDNAVREMESYKLLAEEKDQQIDMLRKEMAVGARNAYKVIDGELLAQKKKEMDALAAKIKASLIPIYNKQQVDRSTYAAINAKTGEEITFNWTQENKYYEVDEAQVEQFRQQYQAEQSAVPNLPLDAGQVPAIEPPALITEDQFRSGVSGVSEEPAVVHGDGSQEEVGSDTETVSRAEFEALKADVEMLKLRTGMVA